MPRAARCPGQPESRPARDTGEHRQSLLFRGLGNTSPLSHGAPQPTIPREQYSEFTAAVRNPPAASLHLRGGSRLSVDHRAPNGRPSLNGQSTSALHSGAESRKSRPPGGSGACHRARRAPRGCTCYLSAEGPAGQPSPGRAGFACLGSWPLLM